MFYIIILIKNEKYNVVVWFLLMLMKGCNRSAKGGGEVPELESCG